MRNPKWHRDEVILALDLYYDLESGQMNSNNPEVIKLSELLNRLPIHINRPDQEKFRNANGVNLKLGNFKHYDPDYAGQGLKGGSKLDEAVLNEFYGQRLLLKSTANKIKAAVENKSVVDELYSIPNEEDDTLHSVKIPLSDLDGESKTKEKESSPIRMTIDEIYKKGNLGIRSYHVCKYNNIETIYDLKEYFVKNKSFTKFRNCGRKSNEELIEICNKYQGEHFENRETEIKKENSLKTIISDLTRVQREAINSFIQVNTNSLSVRSKNAISFHLRGNLKIKNFAENILLSDSFNVKNIKNVGAKCVLEIEIYISIIKDFMIEVSQSDNEKHLISLKNNFLIQRTFSISKIPNKILESESIFLLTDFLLNQNALFDETQTVIVKNAFKIYQNQKESSLDDIAKKVNLTRERVRQIRKLCIDDLFNKLLFIQNFNDDLLQKYNIDINSDQIEINQELVDNINVTNFKYLSREFVSYILYVYLSEKFSLIGEIEDVLQPRYFNARNRHNWKNFYLIEKDIVKEIDFNALANDIENRINDRIVESYSFNFKSYLSKFLTNNNIEFLDTAFPIGEKIINDEFELFLDLDENLIFKRNTKKQAHEYAYEALEHLGKASKVKEIFEKILELYPNYDTDEPKVRVSMKRKNGFVPIGRKSIFGLKKWEKELDNFKGGTIRDIVEEYLSQFTEPLHISEITSHVLKYRPKSNQYSILQNLKLDESGLYIFYKGSHVGLSTKKYTEEHVKSKSIDNSERKSWEERFDALQSFIQKEKRLPYSNGVPEKEIKLYRWLNVQKSKINKGKLNAIKTNKINDIIDKFPSINGKRRSNSSEKYEELIAFVKSKFRLPSASKSGEENLYQFFYKQRKIFDKDELETKEKIQFIEVARILKQQKKHNEELIEWESKLLYWSKHKKEGYKYSPKKEAWWKNK